MKDTVRLEKIRAKLLTLRGDCLEWLPGASVELFDEFIAVEEFDLALHVICDSLLDQSAMSSSHVLVTIEALHRLMEIQDDCLAEIRKKFAE